MREQILAAAEKRARVGGYNGFSFRDLADDVGVKSSSVHYHFPTKADLGAALAQRYTEHAKARLGGPEGLSPDEAIARVTLLFRDALLVEDRMCLCGLFGAERDSLPPAVEAAVAGFFHMLLAFLGASVGEATRAAQLLAQLEGGLILARTLRDPALFDQACGIKPAAL